MTILTDVSPLGAAIAAHFRVQPKCGELLLHLYKNRALHRDRLKQSLGLSSDRGFFVHATNARAAFQGSGGGIRCMLGESMYELTWAGRTEVGKALAAIVADVDQIRVLRGLP